MITPEKLGLNIRKQRRWLEMSQQYVADSVGISQPRIAQFEKGIAIPNAIQLVQIACALHITVGCLLNEN